MTLTPVHDERRSAALGSTLAVVSAAAFGSSGPVAKSLLEAGWSSGAAVLVRLTGAAAILTVVAAIVHGRTWRPTAAAVRVLLLYGVVAMAGIQLAFFSAVRTLEVGVALLIEYLAPVLLLVYSSVRTRSVPPRATVLGAALTMVGLVLVLDLGGVGTVDGVGVAWALAAAVCLAGYFLLSEGGGGTVALPPLVMAAGGTLVGALVLAVAGAIGLVPLVFVGGDVALGGRQLAWYVPGGLLVLVATVLAYATGIHAVQLLGSRTASFLSLLEVLAAVAAAWLLLAELPRPIQLVGGALILAGIVVIRRQGQPPLHRPGASAPG